jgi:hypothetical protein
MELHDYCKVFPPATEEELQEMADDIRVNGLKDSIITLDGMILDGRNRFNACRIAGVEPHFKPYSGYDPLADVVSWNVKRRQLSVSQRATLAVELKPMFEQAARERMQERKGDQAGATKANLPYLAKGQSRDQAASAVGVSGRTVQDAEYVKKNAPELSEEVKAGKMTVNAAKKEVQKRENKTKPIMTKAQAARLRPRMGLQFARCAIVSLEQIKENDEERNEGLKLVKDWITNHEA